MVTIFQPNEGFTLDFSKLTTDDEYYKQTNTNKNKNSDKKKKKLAPLDISKLTKLRAIALENEDCEHIIKFGKFKGIQYKDLLGEEMQKYRKFLKRCPFRNDHIEHFLKWVEDHEKENNDIET